MQRTFNSQIIQCGAKYTAHFNTLEISVCGRDWGINIPISRVGEFCSLFPEENFEDGKYLESLCGKYVRVTEDGFKLLAIHHIIHDISYHVQLPTDS